jgi:hypothetical protein
MKLNKRNRSVIRKVCQKFSTKGFREDPLERKARVIARINKCAIGPVVGIDFGGMDCEGVCSEGHANVHATYYAVQQFMDNFYEGAEGPQHAGIVVPRDDTGSRITRDAGMEAFEDGHAHVLYYH